MAQATHLTRDEEIQKIHRRYTDFYKIGGGLILVLIGIWIGSLLFSDGYATNVYTEILSVIATIVVLDRLNDWRDTQHLKKRLIREAGSQSNETAKAAIDWMRAEGWLTVNDDIQLLKGKNLGYARLQGANLWGVNLENVNLPYSTLSSSLLDNANLSGSNLENATLSEAHLAFANLSSAKLINADLSDTNLKATNLQDAKLLGASLVGAELNILTRLSINTQLPDGSYPTPETDIERFTDPNHPDFWQPDWVKDGE